MVARVLIQNGKMIPITEDTVLENEVLTKAKLVEMYQGNAKIFSKVGGIITVIGFGITGVFCLIPVFVMLSTGMTFSDVWPILACMIGFIAIGLLVHKLSNLSVKRTYEAIVEGRFRFLSDTIAKKTEYTDRDTNSHITRHTYYITGTKHQKEYRMFASWWSLSAVGDPVYIFEVANKKGKYHPQEVFPAKTFTLDAEMQGYVDRQSANTGGFEV